MAECYGLSIVAAEVLSRQRPKGTTVPPYSLSRAEEVGRVNLHLGRGDCRCDPPPSDCIEVPSTELRVERCQKGAPYVRVHSILVS